MATVSRAPPRGALQTFPLPQSPPPTPVALADPGRIALLLPTQGRFAAAADAVQQGFLQAAQEHADRPVVVTYDTGEAPDEVLAAYDRAVADGAGVLVGPLRKHQLRTLLHEREPLRPMLALNQLDAAAVPRDGLFQIGLSPRDEARAAAEAMRLRGWEAAAVLFQDSDWGRKTADAFSAHFRALGGRPGRAEPMPADPGLLSQTVRAVLAASSDSVFIALDAQQAGLAVPLLRFHWNRPLPLVVFATASAYDPALGTRDRRGLELCGMPLVLQRSSAIDRLREEIVAAVPVATVNHARLFGLGYDAYALARTMVRAGLQPGDRYAGVSGNREVQSNGLLRRDVSCAQMPPDLLHANDAPAAMEATTPGTHWNHPALEGSDLLGG